jgi:hypothetical protein
MDNRQYIRYPALPDIRQGNLVSGRIPDVIKGRIIRPDIRPAGYPVHPYVKWWELKFSLLLSSALKCVPRIVAIRGVQTADCHE